MRNLAVIGVGGVGGFFGGKLCQLIPEGLRVAFIARGEHLRAIRDHGLLLSTESEGDLVYRPTLATDRVEDIQNADLILLCVKEFDLRSALLRLKPIVRPATIILPLLNGMDVYERVRTIIANAVVLPACVYVGTHIERPGKITQRGGACKILFGPDPARPDFDPAPLLDLFTRANIKHEWTTRVQQEIWTKFIFICAYGTVTAAHDKSVGEVFASDELRAEVRALMDEIVTLALAQKIELPPDVIDTSLAKAKAFPFETKTSFQRDFERLDKPDERNLFAGAVIQRAAEKNNPTPATARLFGILNTLKPPNLK
ncbi:MAG TPA: 2-dehydropantoate 2-reductase [Verrucomicrobiae bacterium]